MTLIHTWWLKKLCRYFHDNFDCSPIRIITLSPIQPQNLCTRCNMWCAYCLSCRSFLFYWSLSDKWKLFYWELAEYGASGLVICALEILSLTYLLSSVARNPFLCLAAGRRATCSSTVGRYIIDDIHYLRRWEWGGLGGACRWMFARLTWQRWAPLYHRTGRKMSADFLAAAADCPVVLMALRTAQLCSHALRPRLSSVQTRAAARPPPSCSHQLASVLTPSWRQHGHLLLDRKSFTLSCCMAVTPLVFLCISSRSDRVTGGCNY